MSYKYAEKCIVLATGTKDGGGSGFEKLVEYSRISGTFEIVAVASNHADGGVRQRAGRLCVPFIHFPKPWTAERYRSLVHESCARWVIASGWLKFIRGLDPALTINIHPALLSFQHGRFGGFGLFGHHVHEAFEHALTNGELGDAPRAGFTMHFVTDGEGDPEKGYDKGPIFAEVSTSVYSGMAAKEIGGVVNGLEHRWQPILTEMVVTEKIRLEQGKVIVPPRYGLLPDK